MRVHHLQQALGEARELCVQLELNACRQEAKPLEQPLHVRVGHLDPAHAKAGRDLGVLARELGTHLAQMLELALVVFAQARVHRYTRGPARS